MPKTYDFEITRLEGDLKLKANMQEAERLEFDKLKRIKQRKAEKKRIAKQKRLDLKLQKQYELQNIEWEKKRAKELRAEKYQEKKLRLEKEKLKSDELQSLKIEEQRIINLSTGQILMMDENNYMDPFNEGLLRLKKHEMLKNIRERIRYAECCNY